MRVFEIASIIVTLLIGIPQLIDVLNKFIINVLEERRNDNRDQSHLKEKINEWKQYPPKLLSDNNLTRLSSIEYFIHKNIYFLKDEDIKPVLSGNQLVFVYPIGVGLINLIYSFFAFYSAYESLSWNNFHPEVISWLLLSSIGILYLAFSINLINRSFRIVYFKIALWHQGFTFEKRIVHRKPIEYKFVKLKRSIWSHRRDLANNVKNIFIFVTILITLVLLIRESSFQEMFKSHGSLSGVVIEIFIDYLILGTPIFIVSWMLFVLIKTLTYHKEYGSEINNYNELLFVLYILLFVFVSGKVFFFEMYPIEMRFFVAYAVSISIFHFIEFIRKKRIGFVMFFIGGTLSGAIISLFLLTTALYLQELPLNSICNFTLRLFANTVNANGLNLFYKGSLLGAGISISIYALRITLITLSQSNFYFER